MSKPPFNLAAVDSVTPSVLASGSRVLQTHFYADTPEQHVSKLLEWMSPCADALILDAGCGVGEVSRIMASMRPDLLFIMLNISRLQLSHCPPDGERFLRVQGDCHDLSGTVQTSSVDAVMFSSALCQMDADLALAEAFRVLKPEGVLLINDMVGDGDHHLMETELAARVLASDELVRAVEHAGFQVDQSFSPEGDDSAFRALLAQAGKEGIIDGVKPFIVRAVKRGSL